MCTMWHLRTECLSGLCQDSPEPSLRSTVSSPVLGGTCCDGCKEPQSVWSHRLTCDPRQCSPTPAAAPTARMGWALKYNAPEMECCTQQGRNALQPTARTRLAPSKRGVRCLWPGALCVVGSADCCWGSCLVYRVIPVRGYPRRLAAYKCLLKLPDLAPSAIEQGSNSGHQLQQLLRKKEYPPGPRV